MKKTVYYSKALQRLVALVMASLVLVLAACDVTTVPNTAAGQDASIIKAIVSQWQEQEAVGVTKVEAIADDESVIATGTLDALGNLSLELPSSLRDEQFMSLNNTPDCGLSPQSTEVAMIIGLKISNDLGQEGFLIQADNSGGIIRVFSSEDATMRCNGKPNISFTKGWNLMKLDQNANTLTQIQSSNAPWLGGFIVF